MGLLLPPEMEELIPMAEGAEVGVLATAPPLPIMWLSASHPALLSPMFLSWEIGQEHPMVAEKMRWDKLVGCGHHV